MDIYKQTKENPYKYEIITYEGEQIKETEIIYLHKTGLTTYDNDVPITLGSNQELIEH